MKLHGVAYKIIDYLQKPAALLWSTVIICLWILYNIFGPAHLRFDDPTLIFPVLVMIITLLSFLASILDLDSNAEQEVSANIRHKEIMNKLEELSNNFPKG